MIAVLFGASLRRNCRDGPVRGPVRHRGTRPRIVAAEDGADAGATFTQIALAN
jgi:hypothetical protein